MTTHFSYCEFHLGDNLLHLHFLRKLALCNPQRRFVHFVHECYLGQLRDVVCDIPTIELRSIAARESSGERNVWKNADGYWENHPLRNDFAGFYIEWFRKLAAEMGLVSPLFIPQDLVFDYPKLLDPAWPGETFDYLVINSRPCSGQFMAYDHVDYFDPLMKKLVDAGKRVVCTQTPSWLNPALASAKRLDTKDRWALMLASTPDGCGVHCGLTITQIGNLSLRCKNIVAVATGPLWPCLNVWSNPEKLILCIGVPERNIVKGAIYCDSLKAVEKEIGI